MRFRSIHGPGVVNGRTARGIIMSGVTGHMGTDQHLFLSILAPTTPLSRHISKALIRFYKMGVVFMAKLNGHQDHFSMVGSEPSARSAYTWQIFSGSSIKRVCWLTQIWWTGATPIS
jgi:hypothetical protein